MGPTNLVNKRALTPFIPFIEANAGHRVGGGITPAVLPHHRAYGSVPRRFMQHI